MSARHPKRAEGASPTTTEAASLPDEAVGAAMPPHPRHLGASAGSRPGRVSLARARTEARLEAELADPKMRDRLMRQIAAEADFDDPSWVQAETQRRVEELCGYGRPDVLRYINELGVDPRYRSKRPANARDVIEAAAIRKLPYWKVLAEDVLPTRRDNLGRPSRRRLAVAVFESVVLTDGDKVLKRHFAALMGKDDERDWAFGHPAGDGSDCRAYNSITTTLSSMLDHHDPEVVMAVNGAFLAKRRAEFGDDYARYLVIDGMKWETHSLQSQGYSPREQQLLARDYETHGFGYHGPGAGWRGNTLLAMRCLRSGDNVGWLLPPANDREFSSVERLFERVHEHFPQWRPEVLVADREYDVKSLYTNLLARFGVHLICPLRDKLSAEFTHASTEGVPECSKHGLMKRHREREFPDHDHREREGLAFGQRASVDRARTEWRCEKCNITEVTYFKNNPRIYGRYPRGGDHKLFAQRIALQVMRNLAESTNASLQRRGFGLKGEMRAKWASTTRQVEWLAGCALLAMNLRQLIYEEDGPYERARQEAEDLGYLKPQRCTPGALRVLDGGRAAPDAPEAGREALAA